MLINIDEKKKTDKLEITKKSETLKKRFHVKIIYNSKADSIFKTKQNKQFFLYRI